MNEERRKLNGLEAFLANTDGESQAEDLVDLRKMGVDVDAFMKRVDRTTGLQHRINFLEQNETVVWEVLKIADGSTIHDVVAAVRGLTAKIAERDREIERLRGENDQLRKGAQLGPIIGAATIMDQEKQLVAKDKEIERLRGVLSEVHYERDFRVRCNDYIVDKVAAALAASEKE